MSAVLPPIATPGAGDAARSEGVWHAAWRRLRADRVGIVSMAVVGVFLLMIVLTAGGLVARGWQKEVAVPSAPPSFMGAASAAATTEAIPTPTGPIADISSVLYWAARSSPP